MLSATPTDSIALSRLRLDGGQMADRVHSDAVGVNSPPSQSTSGPTVTFFFCPPSPSHSPPP
eukprot:3062992-Prymnesium_polylepis.1